MGLNFSNILVRTGEKCFVQGKDENSRIGLTRPTWELIDTGCCSRKNADSTKLYLQDNYLSVLNNLIHTYKI